MSNVVSNLQRQMVDQQVITRLGEMDREAINLAVIITLSNIEAIINSHIQQGSLYWKRERTALPAGLPSNNLPQGQPYLGLPFRHFSPPPPPPNNSGQEVSAPGEDQDLGGIFDGGGEFGCNGGTTAAQSGRDDDMNRAPITLNY